MYERGSSLQVVCLFKMLIRLVIFCHPSTKITQSWPNPRDFCLFATINLSNHSTRNAMSLRNDCEGYLLTPYSNPICTQSNRLPWEDFKASRLSSCHGNASPKGPYYLNHPIELNCSLICSLGDNRLN